MDVSCEQWAVRCGCGEVFEYPDEEAARRALDWWDNHRHRNARDQTSGPPILLRRKVIVPAWRLADDVAAA